MVHLHQRLHRTPSLKRALGQVNAPTSAVDKQEECSVLHKREAEMVQLRTTNRKRSRCICYARTRCFLLAPVGLWTQSWHNRNPWLRWALWPKQWSAVHIMQEAAGQPASRPPAPLSRTKWPLLMFIQLIGSRLSEGAVCAGDSRMPLLTDLKLCDLPTAARLTTAATATRFKKRLRRGHWQDAQCFCTHKTQESHAWHKWWPLYSRFQMAPQHQ